MNRMIDEYMCHDPKPTIQDLEEVEEQAYVRGYTDCESLNNFFKLRSVLTFTHSIIAVVFFIIGILYATNK